MYNRMVPKVYSSILSSFASWSVNRCCWPHMVPSSCITRKRQYPTTKYHIFHYNLPPCSRPQDTHIRVSLPLSLLDRHWRGFLIRSDRRFYRFLFMFWICLLAWCLGGWYCSYEEIPVLPHLRCTFGHMQNNFPDQRLRYALLLFPVLFDQVGQIALTRVLHEQIKIILVVVEHPWHKAYDIAVVKRGQDTHLIDSIVALVLAHPETTDLRYGWITFLTASCSWVVVSRTR